MQKFFFLLFLVTILFATQVSAIGISPPKIVEDFESGETLTFTYYLINKGQPTDADIEIHGSALSQYVSIEENKVRLSQGVTPIELTVALPDYNDVPNAYGEQIIKIFVAEKPSGGASFSAVTAVEGWLVFNVPTPGEYGEISKLHIPTVVEGTNTSATITIKNRGTIPLQNKRALIEIIDVHNSVVDTISLPAVSVSDEKIVSVDIPSALYDPAKYKATAKFFFDEQKLPAERSETFFVGDTDIQLISHTRALQEGKINKVNLQFQSLWGDPLTSVRAIIFDFEGNEQPLPVIDFKAFEETTVQAFIDVPYLNESPFNVNTSNHTVKTTVTLQFPTGETSNENKDIPLYFTINKQPVPEKTTSTVVSRTTILLIALGVVVLTMLAVILSLVVNRGKKRN